MQHGLEHPLAEGLVKRCLVPGNFELRHGRLSMEKFDFKRLTNSTRNRDKWLVRRTAKSLGSLIAETMPDCGMILTVADGANPLAEGVARSVSRHQKDRPEVLARQTQKLENKTFLIKGGNIHVRDRKVVIVDDVYTVGTNIGLVADTVERFGGIVLGAAVILNRNEYRASTISRPESDPSFIRVHSMIQHPIPTFKSEY